MKLKYKLIPILLLLIVASVKGQTSEYYYYYHGEKIFLTPDRQTIAVVWEGGVDSTRLITGFSQNRPYVSPRCMDNVRKGLVATDQHANGRIATKTYYQEVITDIKVTSSEYSDRINYYRSIPSVVSAHPCFVTSSGRKIGLVNKVYVKLRASGDVNTLYETAALFDLEVLGHNKYLPLWFTLATKRTTRLDPVTISGKLFETGLFACAEPAIVDHELTKATSGVYDYFMPWLNKATPADVVLPDPYFPDQWGLNNTGQYGSDYIGIDIKANLAWEITTGSPSIKIGIFDEGFERDHIDFNNVFGYGYDCQSKGSPAIVYSKHGTAVAGIAGAKRGNWLGIFGVASEARMASISFNSEIATPQDFADGFSWAWQNGIDVINNSWGNNVPSSIIDEAITEAMTNGRDGKGSVVIFAAGNGGNAFIGYPALNNPSAIAVGAISPCGDRKTYTSCDGDHTWGSSYGPRLDIVAPTSESTTDLSGTAGYNTGQDATDYSILDFTRKFGGTSSAAPVVSGVAALILSVNPNLAAQQVKDIIESTAQKIRTDLYTYSTTAGRPNGTWNNEMGYGLVDANKALVLAARTCSDMIPITTNVTSGQTDNESAYNSITASNSIASGAVADYRAGTMVDLVNGFHALPGSAFHAYIAPCDKPLLPRGTVRTATTESPVSDITYNMQYDNINISETPEGIQIYPNPSKGTLNVQISNQNIEPTTIQIFDSMGNNIYNSSPEEILNKTYQINLESHQPGIYVLRVITNQSSKKMKLIVNR